MTGHRLLAGLILGIALGPGCRGVHREAPSEAVAPAAEVVEERWPSGALRLRRHVVRQPDGGLLDHGLFEQWFPSGQLEYVARFEQGRKQGTTVRYHENGRKAMEQEYRDGKRDGTSTTWDESGAKVKEEHWTDGEPDGTWTIWENGQIKWQHTFDRGDPRP